VKTQEIGAAKPRLETGSGNVFDDIGIPEPEAALVKAQLADLIGESLGALGLTQIQGGKLLGIDQGTVSKLINGRLDGFSLERLFRYLNALGSDVEIVVQHRSRSRNPGRLLVKSV
jgi:predicted XRE-type DNA-binding protein